MILCAAIKFHINDTDKDVIIPCWRHGGAYKILSDLGFGPKRGYREIEQGFITDSNKFLNRKEAWEHAVACGQVSQTTVWYKDDHEKWPYELFSEDIY